MTSSSTDLTAVKLARYFALMSEPIRPHRAIAGRVRQLRKRHGWNTQQLAEKLNEVGVPWDKWIIANFENGRRAGISVEEMIALAFVLDVAPVHLIVPPDADGERDQYMLFTRTPRIAPGEADIRYLSPDHARAWIRGEAVHPAQDWRLYFSEVPAHDWHPESRPPRILDEASDVEH